MRNAALIASEFKLDPVRLLADNDEFNTAVRLAAVLHVMEEKKKAYSKDGK